MTHPSPKAKTKKKPREFWVHITYRGLFTYRTPGKQDGCEPECRIIHVREVPTSKPRGRK